MKADRAAKMQAPRSELLKKDETRRAGCTSAKGDPASCAAQKD
jgi:hypothetical protein